MNNRYYKKWLDDNLFNLEIDVVGQINFIGTNFENNQDARLIIQRMFDKEYV